MKLMTKRYPKINVHVMLDLESIKREGLNSNSKRNRVGWIM